MLLFINKIAHTVIEMVLYGIFQYKNYHKSNKYQCFVIPM